MVGSRVNCERFGVEDLNAANAARVDLNGSTESISENNDDIEEEPCDAVRSAIVRSPTDQYGICPGQRPRSAGQWSQASGEDERSSDGLETVSNAEFSGKSKAQL